MQLCQSIPRGQVVAACEEESVTTFNWWTFFLRGNDPYDNHLIMNFLHFPLLFGPLLDLRLLPYAFFRITNMHCRSLNLLPYLSS